MPPCVSDGQRLEDPTDRLAGSRAEQEVEVIGHQAVAEELERIPCVRLLDHPEEGAVVVIIHENIGAIVATIDGVVYQIFVDQPRDPAHPLTLARLRPEVDKNKLTPISPPVGAQEGAIDQQRFSLIHD
jgi:hypothetical protein